MDFEVIALFIMAVLIFGMGFLVYLQDRKSTINKSFGFFVISVALWSFGLTMFYISREPGASLFWTNFLYVSASLIPTFFFYFSLAFPTGRISISRFKQLLIFVPNAVLFSLFFFSALVVRKVDIIDGVKVIIYGPGHILWDLQFDTFFFLAFYNLIKKYKTITGIVKVQLRYIIFGALTGLLLAGTTNVILRWFGVFRYLWLGPELTLVWVVAVTYAIVRYRFMDIRVVMGKGAIYVFSFLSVIASAFLMIFLNNQLAQPISFNFFFPITIIVAVLLFQLFFRFFEKLASKYFYYVFYSYQTVLTDLGERLTRVLELKKLSALITSTLIRTMKLDRTIILLRNPETGDYQIQKNIGFKEENGISLVRDNFLTRYLEKTQNPLVYEEISLVMRDVKDEKERKNLENLKKNMKRIEAALCLPLFREKKVIGMVVLGNKVSGDPYSQQDLGLLATLSSQASIALQNARLYNQVQDLSQNLQEKVDEQTRELRQAYEELKKLDKAKSEFISIASHQLRTPLTAIKGYISMILEGDYGKLPGKATKSMENVYQSNERLIKLVNGLLSISRIEAGRMEIKKQRMSVEPLIESLIEELKPQVQQKNLYLKFKKPRTKMPQLLADKEKLRQVLLNVLDNGLRYTTKGGITVKLEIKNLKLRIIISDTGEGMTEDELSKIFQTFSRGKAGAKLWVEGIGLGLYIAKRFIELQGGRIWAESKGKGKGSSFFVELPVK